jgi:hypothetical protein
VQCPCVLCVLFCVHRSASVQVVYSITVVQYILHINLYIYKVRASVSQVCALVITKSEHRPYWGQTRAVAFAVSAKEFGIFFGFCPCSWGSVLLCLKSCQGINLWICSDGSHYRNYKLSWQWQWRP